MISEQQVKLDNATSGIRPSFKYEVLRKPGGLGVFTGKKFHFVGAGGVGMSGLAKLVIKAGGIVSGSDKESNTVIEGLCKLGADVKIGHLAKNVGDGLEAVVISAAIGDDNPELMQARRTGCRVYKYAQMLGEVMDCFSGIAVAGTHGKSTTSAWLTYVLSEAGLEPSFIIGADVPQLVGSSTAADGQYFVAEACEYDRSFLNLKPKIGVILNIEADHLDYYKDVDEIIDAFGDFAAGVKPDGVIIANGEDENVRKALTRCRGNYKTFGFDKNFEYSARNIAFIDGIYVFNFYRDGKYIGPAKVSLPGQHNVLNALAVIATACEAGLEADRVLELLSGFAGIDRRLMLKGQLGGVTVVDDYGHHPTEIRASLEAIRQKYGPKRIWCVFQPHQYSRTRFLLDDFAKSFSLADITIVPDIYFVRDSAESKKQIISQMHADRINENGSEAIFIDGFEAIVEHLKSNVRPCDLVVTMGAGDIWKVADEYIWWLKRNC